MNGRVEEERAKRERESILTSNEKGKEENDWKLGMEIKPFESMQDECSELLLLHASVVKVPFLLLLLLLLLLLWRR